MTYLNLDQNDLNVPQRSLNTLQRYTATEWRLLILLPKSPFEITFPKI